MATEVSTYNVVRSKRCITADIGGQVFDSAPSERPETANTPVSSIKSVRQDYVQRTTNKGKGMSVRKLLLLYISRHTIHFASAHMRKMKKETRAFV